MLWLALLFVYLQRKTSLVIAEVIFKFPPTCCLMIEERTRIEVDELIIWIVNMTSLVKLHKAWMHRFSHSEHIWPCYHSMCFTHFLCVEKKQANLVWNQPQRMLRTFSVSRRGHAGPCAPASGWQSRLLTKPQICSRGFYFPRLHMLSGYDRIHLTLHGYLKRLCMFLKICML